MRVRKKWLAAASAAVLTVLAVLPFAPNVNAAEEALDQVKPEVTSTLGDVSDAKVGDTISVPIKFTTNQKLIAGITGKIGYDSSRLSLESVEYTDGIPKGLSTLNKETGVFVYNNKTLFQSGTVNIKFKVLKCAENPAEVSVNNLYFSNYNNSDKVNLKSKVTIAHSSLKTDETPATCTENGRKIVTCTDCGTVVSDETLTKLGHDAGEWVTTVKPTATTRGQAELRCTRDGFVLDTKELPILGDSDGDGRLTLVDAIQLLDHITAGDTLTADTFDFNGDGEVTLADAIALLDYITAND